MKGKMDGECQQRKGILARKYHMETLELKNIIPKLRVYRINLTTD